MPVPSLRKLDAFLGDETVRFVLTGGGVALLFYVLTFGFIRMGVTPFPATLTAYAIGFATSYTIQHAWTFRGRQAHGRAFPRYLAAQLVAALVASAVARSCGRAGLPTALVALAPTLTGSALSYLLSRYWVFSLRS